MTKLILKGMCSRYSTHCSELPAVEWCKHCPTWLCYADTSPAFMDSLWGVFRGTIISSCLWPALLHTLLTVWPIDGAVVYRWDPNTAEELNKNIQNKVSLLSKMSIKTCACNLVTDMPPVYEERESFQILL